MDDEMHLGVNHAGANLKELQIAQIRTRPIGHGKTISSQRGVIYIVGEDGTGASVCKDDGLGQDVNLSTSLKAPCPPHLTLFMDKVQEPHALQDLDPLFQGSLF